MVDSELERVAALGEGVDAEPGAILIDQGDVGTACFLVLEGDGGIYLGDEQVASIGPGAIVGEMALIGHKPRHASARPLPAMRLLSFDLRHFNRVLDEMPAAPDPLHGPLPDTAPDNAQ